MMETWKLTALCSLTALVVAGCERREPATAPAPQPEFLASWYFDDDAVGQLPPGFTAKQNNPTVELATWQVVADPEGPSKPNVLEVRTENDNATHNLLLAGDTSFGDLNLAVRVRGQSGEHDQGGGLIWRAKDENNYYICRINPLENNFRAYKVVDGKRQQLATMEFQAETGRWYDLRAKMVGDQIECFVDSRKLLEVTDAEFAEPGMVGLWTKADASTSFDNFVVADPITAPPNYPQ